MLISPSYQHTEQADERMHKECVRKISISCVQGLLIVSVETFFVILLTWIQYSLRAHFWSGLIRPIFINYLGKLWHVFEFCDEYFTIEKQMMRPGMSADVEPSAVASRKNSRRWLKCRFEPA